MEIEQARNWLEDKEIKTVSERAGIRYMRLLRFANGQQKQLKGTDWQALVNYIQASLNFGVNNDK